MTTKQSLRAALTALPLAGVLTLGLATPAGAEPPGIPDPATAQAELGELVVAPEGSLDGYDRDKFPHWNEGSDGCSTREAVLKRDGENVEVGSDCYPTSGTWNSPYDGGSWTKPSDLDIDHVVPLAAAWRSGAAQWSQEQRQAFANDLESPQLIAVTDNVNQEKSDQPPDQWLPPEAGYHCTYASMWIGSKHKYELTVTEAEKGALEQALGTC
ncbi:MULTISPECIES: HNH endonuclease family protein [unclassified Saccharopolyspora]|uniref:HNH endonuclease family protein n=1 Tax=Saccharopolyspora TaxID=1835 RepID=UPI00190AD2E5|nr:HNH endonuclease family protein [Saccharopolyspora sp. HNM0986]MBK0866030.1 HNH endonuclease [Saccharopolyspora sp. HNM0986]